MWKFQTQNVDWVSACYFHLFFLMIFWSYIWFSLRDIFTDTNLGTNRARQLQNLEIIVADISTFEMEASYDRIFSIEMFEVQLSWALLMQSLSFGV